jgi:hypothetical protein
MAVRPPATWRCALPPSTAVARELRRRGARHGVALAALTLWGAVPRRQRSPAPRLRPPEDDDVLNSTSQLLFSGASMPSGTNQRAARK